MLMIIVIVLMNVNVRDEDERVWTFYGHCVQRQHELIQPMFDGNLQVHTLARLEPPLLK